MQAFLLPNREGLKANWGTYAVSVDVLEWLTGIDFFAAMADDVEAAMECENDFGAWKGKRSRQMSNGQSTATSSGAAQQCKGIAKSTGQRCKSRTTNANGYCDAHQNQAPK